MAALDGVDEGALGGRTDVDRGRSVSRPGTVGAGRSQVGFVDRIFALTEVVAPAHVALGTDMDGNFKPLMNSYRQLPILVSELLRRGYGEANVVGLVGGNFRRLFEAWLGGRTT